jgi:hypothetical protein
METLEKMTRALEVPLYQLFYEGDEPPAIPNLLKRRTSDASAWGSTGKNSIYMHKLVKCLSKSTDSGRKLLLALAQKVSGERRRRVSKLREKKNGQRLTTQPIRGESEALFPLCPVSGPLQRHFPSWLSAFFHQFRTYSRCDFLCVDFVSCSGSREVLNLSLAIGSDCIRDNTTTVRARLVVSRRVAGRLSYSFISPHSLWNRCFAFIR